MESSHLELDCVQEVLLKGLGLRSPERVLISAPFASPARGRRWRQPLRLRLLLLALGARGRGGVLGGCGVGGCGVGNGCQLVQFNKHSGHDGLVPPPLL